METFPLMVDFCIVMCYAVFVIKKAGQRPGAALQQRRGQMRTIQDLKEKKKALGLTNQEVADLSGVPLGTVQKVFSGATRSPGSNTIMAIERALFPREKMPEATARRTDGHADMIKESPAPYGDAEHAAAKADGTYTYADYVALPDDRRVELIDGRFYDMAAPNTRHQIVLGQLHLQFAACMQAHPECMVLLSPLDVMLDGDDRTVVQPDLVILCDRSKMRKGRIFGAPDMLIEIVSPGSRRMDFLLKVAKYIPAGVREYWIIDYKKRQVMIYRNNEDNEDLDISLLPMDEDIPVGISGGSCIIRMGEILNYLDALGDI